MFLGTNYLIKLNLMELSPRCSLCITCEMSPFFPFKISLLCLLFWANLTQSPLKILGGSDCLQDVYQQIHSGNHNTGYNFISLTAR